MTTVLEIVRRLCDGEKSTHIQKELGLTPHYFEEALNRIRRKCPLPNDKRSFVAVKDKIYANIEAMQKHEQSMRDLTEEYKKSVFNFDF